MIKRKFSTNIYIATVIRLLLILFIFQISRLGFFIFNHDFFPEVTFWSYLRLAWVGIMFDISIILYINSLFVIMEVLPFKFKYNEIYQTVVKYLFLITNSVLILVNTADYVYYGFTKRRTTAIIFEEFKNDDNIFGILLKSTLNYWYVTLICIILISLLVYGYNRISIRRAIFPSPLKFYSISTVALILGLATLVIGTRGGFHKNRPIKIGKADEFVKNLGDQAIILNTPFSILLTLGENKLTEYKYFDEETLNNLYTTTHTPNTESPFTKKNVIIITLECFGKEFIGSLNNCENLKNHKGYTPFLDSLIGESISFFHAFANGTKSVKAMPAILASIPSTTEPFALSSYAQNSYKSVVTLLKEQGYESMFYHGAQHGSLGISSFVKKAGVENYIGEEEYIVAHGNNDHDGTWGIWDEPFLKFAAEDISKYKEPFIATIFTLTSHEPYKIPKEYDGVFDEGDLEIHKAVGYTDNALRLFFEEIKTKSWYENTLFVLTADHVSSPFYENYKTLHGLHSVPLIFYTPSGELKKESRYDNAQHIDIMPTILDYLNYDKPYFSFGRSLLDETKDNDFAMFYIYDSYVAIHGEFLLVFNGTKSTALYNYREDWKLSNNLLDSEKEIAKKLEDKIKAFIQTYNTSLIHNKMS